jgi:rhamnose utilization protein RhaD (predicted bifunctional aldolase and dehydrogenase)/NAD(P)-dependent dehydrogenase (short-subunit alcohol dehydrogenase family)
MRSLWSEREAEAAVERYAAQGVNSDLALRVYTTRLLGGVPELVLHGGGNTSVKTAMRDTLGDEVDVLCVKGSGWDMAGIEPAGLPAVRLEPLRRLRRLERLSDEDMVNVQRCNLLDAAAPTPSVETLFHAFLPHKFVDHTHANAVLAVSDQPDGEDLLREVYEDRAVVVPYVMPGFALSVMASEAQAGAPGAEGLVLHKHGIFSWGEDARTAYERMIELVSLAEARLARGRRPVFAAAPLPAAVAGAAEVAPILRGLAAIPLDGDGDHRRFVLEFRTSAGILEFAGGADVERYSQAGVITPDHVIRTKARPLLVPAPEAGRLDVFAAAAREAFARYADEYRAYFARNDERAVPRRRALDPVPRVVLVPGLGLFALGGSAREARVAADVAENAVATIAAAESIGRFESISEADTFDVEYWSLEQAKLAAGRAERPLARQVVLVTGGGSGIGAATAEAFAAAGAEVVVVDRDGEAASAVAARIGGVGIAADVTAAADVCAAFDEAATRLGGVDIVVSNAGAAWQGRIGDVDEGTLRDSFELNFFAHQLVAQRAVRTMVAQGTGGCLLFNVSKQAVNPGPDFGPYGLPKAATLSLLRQYAVDHGRDGIRANGVNADRVRTGLLTDEMVRSRARARGVSERDYLAGNLLGREVRASDVAQAFVALAQASRTTGAVLTVDGGNIAAALR